MIEGNNNFWSNGLLSKNCVDEVDLIRYPNAYEEAKLIPEEQRDCNGVRQPPLTVLTSSRKSASGLVQKEIDEAQEKGTAVRHWSILDVAERCPDEKHRPDLPKMSAYLLDHELVTLLPKEWEELNQADPKKAADYSKKELYWGCLNNCPRRVAAGCQGRLAGVTSRARMLKSISDIIGKFLDVTAEMGVAQLMCWKPGNEGSVYKHFSRKRHCLSLQEMWLTVTGEEPPKHIVLIKQALIDLFIARKVKWAVGMDFGFTHNFAVSLWAIDGRRAFLVDAFEVSGLELNQKIELCDKRIGKYKKHGMVVWPDPAYPSDIKTFRMRGYIMKTHTKDVLGGIDRVRDKLNPPLGHEPELFMLRNDPAGDMMATRFEAYKWATDAQGRSLDQPDDKDDDTMDGVRYVISNEFRGKGKVVSPTKDTPEPIQPALTPKSWMAAKVSELTGGVGSQQVVVGTRIKRGGFFSDFS